MLSSRIGKVPFSISFRALVASRLASTDRVALAALADSQKCVALAPNWGKGYVRLGSALQNLKHVEEALEAYKKGLACDGNDAGTVESLKKGLADAQAMWNDIQAAKAAKSDKNDSESTKKAAELKQLGNDALAKKDYKLAIEHYSEAINIDLDNPIIYSSTPPPPPSHVIDSKTLPSEKASTSPLRLMR